MKIIFNGQLRDQYDPGIQVSAFSSAVQYGQSVFETFRTIDGRAPGTLKKHWERLFASARIIGLELPSALNQAVLDKALTDLRATLDQSQDYRCKVLANADWWWLKAEPLKLPPLEVYDQGVLVNDVEESRIFPEAKSASPLYAFYQAQQVQAGVFETLFFSASGQLLEANISNVIAVINGQLISPEQDVLPGITVREIFAHATVAGFDTKFASISREELQGATEIFLTNAIKGLVPVRKWDKWERLSTEVYEQLR